MMFDTILLVTILGLLLWVRHLAMRVQRQRPLILRAKFRWHIASGKEGWLGRLPRGPLKRLLGVLCFVGVHVFSYSYYHALEYDLEDWQIYHLRRCSRCGSVLRADNVAYFYEGTWQVFLDPASKDDTGRSLDDVVQRVASRNLATLPEHRHTGAGDVDREYTKPTIVDWGSIDLGERWRERYRE